MLMIRVDKKTWAKVEHIVSIAEDWQKRGISTRAEVVLVKNQIWDLNKAQIDWLLNEMLKVEKNLPFYKGGNHHGLSMPGMSKNT